MTGPDLIFLYGESAPLCTHHIDKHYIGYCTLQYMASGSVELWLDARHYLLKGPSFWSAYPGPRVRFHAAPGTQSWAHRYIAFQGPRVKQWERDGLFPIAPRPSPASPGGADFGLRFDNLLRHSRRTDRRGVLRAVHLLEDILLELAETPKPSELPPPWLNLAMKAIAAHATGGSPDYEALAEELGTSQSTLRRRFHEATGSSPHGYLLQCRAQSARQLLGETTLSIKEIAQRLGYSDVYFFSRQFRQLTGVPPATYRRSRHG